MAELAIHEPHYFNVESEQKTAIVHLFHNPIPADGPRDEGPEWAREVDDIYLIGGVGPDGPTVKTVTNGEATEWSSGGSVIAHRSIMIRNDRTESVNITYMLPVPEIDAIGSIQTAFGAGGERTLDISVIDNYITLDSNRTGIVFTYNDTVLDVQEIRYWSTEFYKIPIPANYDSTTPIIMTTGA